MPLEIKVIYCIVQIIYIYTVWKIYTEKKLNLYREETKIKDVFSNVA